MADDLIPPPIRDGGTGSVQVPGVTAPDYRQYQQPVELDVRRINADADAVVSESHQRAAALAGVFKDFNDSVQSIANPMLKQAGTQAGAAAGAAGQGAPKTGLQAATAYGESYNAAVHQTYITSTQLALEQQLSDIEGKNQGNPAGFQAQAGAAVQGAIKNADPLYQPELTLWAQNRIQAGLNRQNNQKADDVRNNALATYQSATPDLITASLHTAAALPGAQGDQVIAKLVSDDLDRLAALVASHTISPEQAVAMHSKMVQDTHSQLSGQKVDLSLQPILSVMKADVPRAEQMIMQADPNLTPEENQARTAEFLKEREQYLKLQTGANADGLAALHARLEADRKDGTFDPANEAQARVYFHSGALSEEGYGAVLADSLRNQRAQIEHDANVQMVDDIVHGVRQSSLDPKNVEQQKWVDDWFKQHVADSGVVSNDQYATGAAETFKQTGILPASVSTRVRVGLYSGDAQRAVDAATLAAKIQHVNPTADPFGSNKKAEALSALINENTSVGMSAGQAYQLAVGRTDAPAEVLKTRDKNYGVALKAQGTNMVYLQKQLDSQTPGMFAHAPPVPNSMAAEFDALTREFYSQTGDLAKAREIATSQLRKSWGVSTVNGAPELTKYPIPESRVPEVRADIAAAAKAAGYKGDPADLHLAPIGATDETRGQVFGVVHASGDVVLNQHNRPLQYTLPTGADLAKAHQAHVEQQLDAARKERDFQRQNTSDQHYFEQQLASQYLRGNAQQKQFLGR